MMPWDIALVTASGLLLDRLTELSHRTAQGPDNLALSEQEVEVLQLMPKGSANKQIAGDLSITESTVKTHVANIFQKLEPLQPLGEVPVLIAQQFHAGVEDQPDGQAPNPICWNTNSALGLCSYGGG